MMIFLPVRPQSPMGPPTTKRPVVLIKNWVFLSKHVAGIDFLDDFFDDGLPKVS